MCKKSLICCLIWRSLFTLVSLQRTATLLSPAIRHPSSVGATLEWHTFNTDTLPLWRLLVCTLAILMIRRLPIVFALYRYMPGIFTYTEGIMVGWFGPIGVGALWYMTIAKGHYPDNELFLPVVK